MSHFLLVFDRTQGRILREETFEDPRAALAERFEVEKANRDNRHIEVVVLSADSADALRRTHARYFMTAIEILRATRPSAAAS